MPAIRVRLSKTNALIGMWASSFLAVLFALVGIVGGEGAGVFWFLAVLCGGFAWYYKQRVPVLEIERGEGAGLLSAGGDDFETKLRKLTKLKEDSIISKEEFDKKRAEILKEKW